VWAHVFDPHRPFAAPAEHVAATAVDEVEKQRLIQYWIERNGVRPDTEPWRGDLDELAEHHLAYDAEIHHMDRELERLYRRAEERGLLEGSVWIVTSDHGEGNGSHNMIDHGTTVYQELIGVPLLIHTPDGKFPARRVAGPAHHIDLMPTVAALLDVPLHAKPAPKGTSLLPVLTGTVQRIPERPRLSVRRGRVLAGMDREGEDPVYTLLSGDLKFIYRAKRRNEFYCLSDDPLELVDLAASGHPQLDQLKKEARRIFQGLVEEGDGVTAAEFSDRYRANLRALGYLGGEEELPATNEKRGGE